MTLSEERGSSLGGLVHMLGELAASHLQHVASTSTPTPGGLEGAILNFVDFLYTHLGYFGIVAAMAIESCCIPLPSEIVMPLAGYFVLLHPDRFSLPGVALAGAVGCVLGSLIAYGIGAAGGRPLLLRYGKYVLISHADSDRADHWFARYGAPVAFFSRLLPVVRTYISLPAGIARMNLGQFALFTFLGSLIWSFILALVGYKLGPQIVQLTAIFHDFDIVIVALVAVAIGYYIYRHIQRDRASADGERRAPRSHGEELPRGRF
jgi:membrane protein DedA with SNARE-associated domain